MEWIQQGLNEKGTILKHLLKDMVDFEAVIVLIIAVSQTVRPWSPGVPAQCAACSRVSDPQLIIERD